MDARGTMRERIARMLTTAYGDGLLSETTLAHRLDVLCASRVIEPAGLLDDLTVRAAGTSVAARLSGLVRRIRETVLRELGRQEQPAPMLLALDWDGGDDDLLVGRHRSCDIVLSDAGVSRRHARLRFRDGHWVLQDLKSINGTFVNGVPVGRCQLRPGDQLYVGTVRLLVD